jgi:hypothetical protein
LGGCDNADRTAREPRKAGDNILRIMGLYFEEIRGIHDPRDDIVGQL